MAFIIPDTMRLSETHYKIGRLLTDTTLGRPEDDVIKAHVGNVNRLKVSCPGDSSVGIAIISRLEPRKYNYGMEPTIYSL